MKGEGIFHHYDTFKDQLITGAALIELKALLNTDPKLAIKLFLIDGCNITKRGELLSITAALRRL
jgi:hypothetical protein